MNILIVNYYSFDEGGAGASTLYLANALKRLGNKVYIASRRPYPGFRNFLFKDIRIIPLFGLRDLYLASFLSKIIKRIKIDIIHSSECRFTALGTILAAKRNKIPSVIHFRGFWFCCLKGDLLFKNKHLCEGMNFYKCLKCIKKLRLPWEIYKYYYFKSRTRRLNQAKAKIAISNLVRSKLIERRIDQNIKTI